MESGFSNHVKRTLSPLIAAVTAATALAPMLKSDGWTFRGISIAGAALAVWWTIFVLTKKRRALIEGGGRLPQYPVRVKVLAIVCAIICSAASIYWYWPERSLKGGPNQRFTWLSIRLVNDCEHDVSLRPLLDYVVNRRLPTGEELVEYCGTCLLEAPATRPSSAAPNIVLKPGEAINLRARFCEDPDLTKLWERGDHGIVFALISDLGRMTFDRIVLDAEMRRSPVVMSIKPGYLAPPFDENGTRPNEESRNGDA